MKISCQSCQAKYTIADEKVRGKVVKIRCKKCGSTIVVNGNEPSAEGVASAPPEQDEAPTRVFSYDHHASANDEWTVNVADGDQRSLTTAQLVDLHREGVVNDETYGWREGMDDWLPLGEIEALRSLLAPGAPAARSAPPAAISAPAPAPAPVAAPAPAGPMFAAAASSSGGAAARRPGARGANADLFGGSAAAGGDDDVMTSASTKPKVVDDHEKATGARNENSVLFSLSALTATAGASPSAAKPVGGESSGIVDIKNLVAAPPKPAPARSGVDDIMNLGGGAMFAPSLAVPALAPPPTADLTSAPAFAEEPGASPAAGKKSGGKGAMLGIVGAVAVVAIGAGAFFALGGKKDEGGKPGDTAAATAAAAITAATTTTAAATAAPATAAPATAAPATADSAPAAVAANDKPDDKDKGTTETAAVAPGSTPQRGNKTEKAEKVEKAAPAEKPPSAAAAAAAAAAATPAPAATPAAPAADGAPFDRAAAMSALSSAASAASGCKKPDGPTGSGRVSVTFAPSGNATTANVEGPPFAGTSVGGCVAARFRGARVPPFSGGTVTVHKSFSIN